MRSLALLVLMSAANSALAAPTEADLVAYREKLKEYTRAGATVDETVRGLKGWFGWDFEATPDYVRGTVDYLVVLRDTRQNNMVYYLRTIGTIVPAKPVSFYLEPEK